MPLYTRTDTGWNPLSPAYPLSRDHIRARAMFRQDSWWWKRLPDTRPVDTNNTAIVASLKTNVTGINLDRYSYTPRIVIASNTDPVVKFTYDQTSGYAEHPDLIRTQLTGIHIPRDANPAAGTDMEIVIYNRDTGQMTDIWGATKVDDLNWKARWAGTIQNTANSDGVHINPWGAVASGFAFLPGMVTPDELRDGWIGHVVGIGLPSRMVNSVVSTPATRTDGAASGTGTISEGQRVFLPTGLNLDTLGLTRTGKIIARAAQEYGFIVWDLGPDSTTIRCINATGMTPDPYATILAGHTDYPLKGFPVDRLNVMPRNWMPA